MAGNIFILIYKHSTTKMVSIEQYEKESQNQSNQDETISNYTFGCEMNPSKYQSMILPESEVLLEMLIGSMEAQQCEGKSKIAQSEKCWLRTKSMAYK